MPCASMRIIKVRREHTTVLHCTVSTRVIVVAYAYNAGTKASHKTMLDGNRRT